MVRGVYGWATTKDPLILPRLQYRTQESFCDTRSRSDSHMEVTDWFLDGMMGSNRGEMFIPLVETSPPVLVGLSFSISVVSRVSADMTNRVPTPGYLQGRLQNTGCNLSDSPMVQ